MSEEPSNAQPSRRAQTGRTFRFFVSSTFSDLKEERNALARWVFPKLRALCESRGYKFQAVDLRWGVRDEATVDQQTVRICLDEIARCQKLSPKPNFIVLLGDRYGWCPPPNVIPAEEMDVLRAHLQAVGSLELVASWYLRDDNAVPPEWVLQPRRGKYEVDGVWAPVERRLHDALAAAAETAGLGETASRKYRGSATELEIVRGALHVEDAREHVFAFFRKIENLDDVKRALPATVGQARQARDTDPNGVAAAALDLLDTRVATGPGEPDDDQPLAWDEDAGNALQRLKASLKDQLGDVNVWRYGATWTDGALDLAGMLGELAAEMEPPPIDAALPETRNVCEAVWQRISRVLVAEMEALDEKDHDPLEVERRAHAAFAKDRQRVFVGRHEPLRRIAAYLKGGPARPLVVHGPSGSGKSALMARAIADARAAHPEAVVVERFIGASPGASEIRPLLESICQEISRAFGSDEAAIGDYPKLVAELPKRLALATPARPLIVFLDALDQLGETDEGKRLVWLPRELPTNVRIVVSTLEDDKYQCFPVLRAGTDDGDEQDFVPVEPLTKSEGHEILKEWLKGSRDGDGPARAPRKLTQAESGQLGQLDSVLAKFEKEGSPLYFKLAFEEARRWHSYDGDAPAAALPEDVAGMIRALYRRLSDASQHGAIVTARALAYLAAARYGVSDEEMLDLLWRDPSAKAELQEHARKHHRLPEGTDALPPVIWSRLYFDLEPYLAEREIFGVRLLSFYHRQLGEVAAEEYLAALTRERIHADVADYFVDRWQRPDTHALLELVAHLVRAGREGEAKDLLLLYEWLAKKLAATNIHWLLADYDELALDRQEPAGLVQGALRLSSHVVANRPEELSSQLRARMLDMGEAAIQHLLEDAAAVFAPAFVPIRRSLDAPGGSLLRTVEEFGIGALSADGQVALGNEVGNGQLLLWNVDSGTVRRRLQQIPGLTQTHLAMSADGGIVCGSSGEELRVWDGVSGKLLRTIRDQAPIAGVAVSSDSRTAISVTWSFRVWDIASGQLLRSVDFYRDRSQRFFASGLTRDGRMAVLAAADGTIEVWDIASVGTVRVLGVPRNDVRSVPGDDVVHAVALSDNGKTIASCFPRRMEVWDAESGELRHTLVDKGWFTSLAISGDGQLAVTGSGAPTPPDWRHEKRVRLWNLHEGRLVAALSGHSMHVTSVLMSADGRVVVSGSYDGIRKVWDVNPKSVARSSQEDRKTAGAVAITTDRRTAVLGTDRSIEVWDLVSNKLLDTLDGHRAPVTVVRVTRDCRFAVSGSLDKTLKVWDIAARTLIHTLAGHRDGVYGLSLSADGETAISGSDDTTLGVWNIPSGTLIHILRGHTGWVRNVAVSADGLIAVSASHDGTLKVWSVARATLGRSFKAEGCLWGNLTGGGLAATERWIAVSVSAAFPNPKKWVEVRDVNSGDVLHTLEEPVELLALSDEGQIAAVTAQYRQVKVWDLGFGRLLAVFTGDALFESVAISPDGRRVVAGDILGRLHVFDVLLSGPDNGSSPLTP